MLPHGHTRVSRGCQAYCKWATLVIILLAAVAYIQTSRHHRNAHTNPSTVHTEPGESKIPKVLENVSEIKSAVHEVIDGTEIVWQSIPGAKAIVFLAHGCSHSATDFFRHGAQCTKCLGLPQEYNIVKRCLERGYLPVAISSQDRDFSRCWSGGDVPVVASVLRSLMQRESLLHLPVVAIGASSGGGFLPHLAKGMHLAAINVQIMGAPETIFSADFPPTIFTHMPRDERTAAQVKRDIEVLQQLNVPTKEQLAQPLPITPRFFHDRTLGEIDFPTSQAIFNQLAQQGYLSKEGYLEMDPRRSAWRSVLREVVPASIPLGADASAISELMNVAWAMHEYVSDFIDDTLDFFDKSLTRSEISPMVA